MTIYVPGKLTLAKEFTVQDYMWSFPQQYGLWSPAEITTALWLDATDSSTITTVSGVVSQWNDKSGNSRNAAQSTPGSRPTVTANAQNGKSVLTFDGTDDFMTVAHNTALNAQISPSTVAVVYKKSAGFRILQRGLGAGGAADDWFFDDTTILSVAGSYTTEYPSNQNVWGIDIGTWDGSTIKHWRNGTKLAATIVTAGAIINGEIDPSSTPTTNTDSLYIGKRENPSGTSGIMTGQIAGILICNTALSDVDRQKLEGYYAHLLGLTASLPSDHPYKLVGPTP